MHLNMTPFFRISMSSVVVYVFVLVGINGALYPVLIHAPYFSPYLSVLVCLIDPVCPLMLFLLYLLIHPLLLLWMCCAVCVRRDEREG
jgi:hypothetical protein